MDLETHIALVLPQVPVRQCWCEIFTASGQTSLVSSLIPGPVFSLGWA
jgi:hypothetical protein